MTPAVPAELADFLGRPTPPAWAGAAAAALPDLLLDHANCEKKAASTALSLMFRYARREELVLRLSRLAREELRHYEQVRRIMRARGVAWRPLGASRYAAGLREACAKTEPDRLVDLLLAGALIEARSAERFALLAPLLDDELKRFYRGLLAAEARHFRDYLGLAESCGSGHGAVETRLAGLREIENRLACEPDGEIRFHSGPPAGAAQRISASSA